LESKQATRFSNVDLYSDEVLRDPYQIYRELRDMAPAIWMTSSNAWFLGRHEIVRAAMRDGKSWSSAQGVGLNSTICAEEGRFGQRSPRAYSDAKAFYGSAKRGRTERRRANDRLAYG